MLVPSTVPHGSLSSLLTSWGPDAITELDLSDFDTLESEQPINDLWNFVSEFKPDEKGKKGSFAFPNRLARLDLPDMSFGNTSHMATSIKELFKNLETFQVGQIMRLYAKDNSKDPMEDDSIAEWVKTFKVEELDWQKPDLDIFPLVTMGEAGKSNLRIITLYTNGHWGVLYHWLSLDGLFSMIGVSHSVFVSPWLHQLTTNLNHIVAQSNYSHYTKARDSC